MWIYKNQIIDQLPDGCVGFVYLITNCLTGRQYIGKKLAKFSKIKYKMHTQKNGLRVRKKIKSHIDSDWLTYWGSSKELSADIATVGVSNFCREILHFCTSKALCSYLEAKEQFLRGVLESDHWYNAQIQVRTHKNHILNKL